MNALGIVGSPRNRGNTEQLMNLVLETIAKQDINTELISLAGKEIRPCTACMACKGKEECPINDDLFPIYLKMKEAHGYGRRCDGEESGIDKQGGDHRSSDESVMGLG